MTEPIRGAWTQEITGKTPEVQQIINDIIKAKLISAEDIRVAVVTTPEGLRKIADGRYLVVDKAEREGLGHFSPTRKTLVRRGGIMGYKTIEVYAEPKVLDSNTLRVGQSRLVDVSGFIRPVSMVIEPRVSGPLAGKAVYLDRYYDWILGRDSDGSIVLVPLRKP